MQTCSSSNNKNITVLSPSSRMRPRVDYDYIAVLDFEANCIPDPKRDPVWADPKFRDYPGFQAEIIEFPTVILGRRSPPKKDEKLSEEINISISSWEVIDEFRSFVRPTKFATITEFCTHLTGVRQSDVDSAPQFPEVWSQWQAFMSKFPKALLVTCGDWDLIQMLPKQWHLSPAIISSSSESNIKNDEEKMKINISNDRSSKRDEEITGRSSKITQTNENNINYKDQQAVVQVQPPRSFLKSNSEMKVGPPQKKNAKNKIYPIKSWCNIKHIFTEEHANAGIANKATGMGGMLRALGITLTGRHHCGIDDCRNIAKIVLHLIDLFGEARVVRVTTDKTKKVEEKNNKKKLFLDDKKKKPVLPVKDNIDKMKPIDDDEKNIIDKMKPSIGVQEEKTILMMSDKKGINDQNIDENHSTSIKETARRSRWGRGGKINLD